MEGSMSRKTSEPSFEINLDPNLYNIELSSYENECRLDFDLQSFDTNLPDLTDKVINSFSVGVGVPAPSFETLKGVTSCLMEINQELVQVILYSKEDLWKTCELFELVEEYFDNSLNTVDICLKKCLKRARDCQLLLMLALKRSQSVEEASGYRYLKVLEELKNFKEEAGPFTVEFFKALDGVNRKLNLQQNELDKKMKSIQAWRKVSNIPFITVFASVFVYAVVASAVAAAPITAALLAATSIPLESLWSWIDSYWKKYEEALSAEWDLVFAMQLGTRVSIKALDGIKRLIDLLQVEIQFLVKCAEATIKEEAVKMMIEELYKQQKIFIEDVQAVVNQVDMCSRDIRRARTVILQGKIKRQD